MLAGKQFSYPSFNGQFFAVIFKAAAGAFIDDVNGFNEYLTTKVPALPKDLTTQVVFQQATDAVTIQPGQGDEQYTVIGGGDKAFPVEYSVSGWYKWTGPYAADWHLVFRLTMNSKADNQDYQRMGDRVLTVFANKANFYHCPTYKYVNMNAAGDANVVQNQQHDGLIQAWHYVYFGYSRTAKRAFVFIQFKNGVKTLDYPNVNHYLTERFFFVQRDARYQNYNGQIALQQVILGNGAFKAATDNHNKIGRAHV